jgi:hypothetical protein
MAQEVLLDDAGFLREIVQRVLQEVLETEMTSTWERLPTSALIGGRWPYFLAAH